MYNYMYQYWFRPTALFLEPSHAALYLVPFLMINLLKKNIGKIDFIISILVSAAIFLTSAGTGVLLATVIWIIFVIKNLVYNTKTRFPILILLLFVIPVIALISVKVPAFSKVFDLFSARIDSVQVESSSSISVRVFKGFEFYTILSPLEQFLGMGMGTYESYASINQLDGTFNYEYMSSISYILCSVGIVGFCLFSIFLFSAFKSSKSYYRRTLLFVLILMYFTGSTLFGSFDYIFYILLLSSNSTTAKVVTAIKPKDIAPRSAAKC